MTSYHVRMLGAPWLEWPRHTHGIAEGKRRLRRDGDGLEFTEPRNVEEFLAIW